MKKIPTIFNRNSERMSEVLPEPNPECAWVFNGEGVATRKYDGTCCLVHKGRLYKRREIKPGKQIPMNFALEEYDPQTGKSVGWVPADPELKEDRWHFEAFHESFPDGTYELLGPKVQGNPEGLSEHTLVSHQGAEQYENVPRSYDGLFEWLSDKDIEGLVFHHNDGMMAKIKLKDFGLERKK